MQHIRLLSCDMALGTLGSWHLPWLARVILSTNLLGSNQGLGAMVTDGSLQKSFRQRRMLPQSIWDSQYGLYQQSSHNQGRGLGYWCEGQSAYKSNLGIRFLKYASLSFEPPRGAPAAAMQKWYDYLIQRTISLSGPRVTHA
jgi:hypothetical protein